MSESQFIQEVRLRASLLTGSFNPDRAIRWGTILFSIICDTHRK